MNGSPLDDIAAAVYLRTKILPLLQDQDLDILRVHTSHLYAERFTGIIVEIATQRCPSEGFTNDETALIEQIVNDNAHINKKDYSVAIEYLYSQCHLHSP